MTSRPRRSLGRSVEGFGAAHPRRSRRITATALLVTSFVGAILLGVTAHRWHETLNAARSNHCDQPWPLPTSLILLDWAVVLLAAASLVMAVRALPWSARRRHTAVMTFYVTSAVTVVSLPMIVIFLFPLFVDHTDNWQPWNCDVF